MAKKRKTKNTPELETYYICTSLLDKNTHTYDHIKEIYHKRWNIETNFRHLKYATSLGRIKSKTFDSIEKDVSIHNFIFILVGYIEHLIRTIYKIKDDLQLNKKIDIQILSSNFLHSLLKDKLTNQKLNKLLSTLNIMKLFLIKIIKNRHFKRQTKIPINHWTNQGIYKQKYK